MKNRNWTYYLILILALPACVKVYTPHIKSSDLNKFVVSGHVKTGQLTQTVNVSQTSSIKNPVYDPITGCSVSIQDNENHRFSMADMGDGAYSTMIPPEYLVPGHVFRVEVVTPSGDSLISDYDTLMQVPPVDSISYSIKSVEDPAYGRSTDGLQFYIDLNATNNDSHYYRWNVYETWEYHAVYPLEWYWDGTMHHVFPPDYSKFTCWHTRKIPEIFTLSTSSLTQNKYSNLPLQYVDNTTPKLANGYSMFVEQIALSHTAYNYWDKLRINNTQEGGLYEKQPVSIKGNLHDVNHPDKEVLGFFSAESTTSKRIFVKAMPAFTHYVTPCESFWLKKGFPMIPKSWYPCPVLAGPDGPLPYALSKDCVDCEQLGGTIVKPSFWPN